MAPSHIYTHLSDDLYFREKVQILWGRWVGNLKPTKLRNSGDYSSAELSYEFEESELPRNDSTVRTIARTDINQKSGAVTLTLRQVTAMLKEIQYMSTAKKVVQEALANGTLSPGVVEVGDIYETNKLDIDDVTIAEGQIDYIENTHFKVDAPTGRIEILALPEGASGTGAEVKFKANAITAADNRDEFAILAGEGVTLRLVLRGLHPNGDDIVIPKVKFRVDGSLSLGSDGTDYGDVTITGTILDDITEPAGRQMGYAISIPVAV